MSAVAARAGVGISALYRRYANKEDLLRQVARDGLQQYLDIAEAAVADDRDAWTAFADFMERLLEAQTVAITMNLAGTFAPDEELYAMSMRAAELNEAIVERTKRSGSLRGDIAVDDLSLILEQVSSIRLGDARRTQRAAPAIPGAVPRRTEVDGSRPAAGPTTPARRARLEVVATLMRAVVQDRYGPPRSSTSRRSNGPCRPPVRCSSASAPRPSARPTRTSGAHRPGSGACSPAPTAQVAHARRRLRRRRRGRRGGGRQSSRRATRSSGSSGCSVRTPTTSGSRNAARSRRSRRI